MLAPFLGDKDISVALEMVCTGTSKWYLAINTASGPSLAVRNPCHLCKSAALKSKMDFRMG